MSSPLAVRITNIVSVTQNGTSIYGIRSIMIKADKGKLAPILNEGDLYPIGAENLGLPDFPVTTTAVFEFDDESMIAALALGVGVLAITKKKAQGGGNATILIGNHQFKGVSSSQKLQDFGQPSLDGVAFSDDGATIPLSMD